MASFLVWTVWCLCFLLAHGLILRNAARAPFQDDLELLPLLLPWRELTWGDMCSLHNEHRIALPRVILLGLIEATRDFRTPMLAQVWMAGAMAAWMMGTARMLRGRASLADAFFPLLWLTPGNTENLLMAFQVSVLLPVLLGASIWMLAIRAREDLGPARVALMGLCLLALPLCGGHGLVQVPAFLALFALIAWKGLRSGDRLPRRSGRVAAAVLAACLLVVAFYFVGYETPPGPQRSAHLLPAARATLQFLVLSVGIAGETWWPWTGIGLSLLVAGAVRALARAYRRLPAVRLPAAALACGMAAPILMGLAMGIRRASTYAGYGFAWRYATLAAPVLAAAVFALLLHAPRRLAAAVQLLLLAGLLALWPENVRLGEIHSSNRRLDAWELDQLWGGPVPLEEIAERLKGRMYATTPDLLARLELLEQTGLMPARGEAVYRQESSIFASVATPEGRPTAGRVGRHPAIFAPPPGLLVLERPAGAEHLMAGVGVAPHPGFPGAPAPTGTVTFRVEHQVPGEPAKLLMERTLHLEGTWIEEPRGFRTRLPPEVPGARLLLRTLASDVPGPAAAYWAALAFD